MAPFPALSSILRTVALRLPMFMQRATILREYRIWNENVLGPIIELDSAAQSLVNGAMIMHYEFLKELLAVEVSEFFQVRYTASRH